MSLSCSCGEWDGESWWYEPPDDFSVLDTKRGRRCQSCGEIIPVGASCLKFSRNRPPNGDYEENRFGDEVPLAPEYLCGDCGEIYLNLTDAGYCLALGTDLREDMEEYWERTGFKPNGTEEGKS